MYFVSTGIQYVFCTIILYNCAVKYESFYVPSMVEPFLYQVITVTLIVMTRVNSSEALVNLWIKIFEYFRDDISKWSFMAFVEMFEL